MGLLFGLAPLVAGLLLRAKRAQATTPAPVSIPAGPAPKMGAGASGDLYAMIRKRRRAGRSGTIMTGDLEPMDLGKRTLLG